MLSLLQEANVQVKNSKIVLPSDTKHVKLDVGLSYGAPMTQHWLTHQENLLVIGFEPNPESIALLRSSGNKKKAEWHGDILEHKFLNKQCFILPVALGAKSEEKRTFYITTRDEGCSSFYQPSGVLFNTEKVIDVPVVTLAEVLSYFPWEEIPYIDYLKIDAQGADLDILRGAGDYLDRIVYVTAESTVGNLYLDVKDNETSKVDAFMFERGFFRIIHPNTSDPTYLNYRFRDIASSIFIYQQG
jgi:FkbM family methyltransferase